MATINVLDSAGLTVAIEKPLPPGTALDAAARPVAFSTEGKAQLGAVAETAPASDTASSGLNGRLQRIAQRLTTLLGAGAATIAKAEDAPSADADVGVPAMAVRKATPANTSGADGDYEMLQMSAGRLWISAILEVGAALIGKVGIDQTTPGTTNAVAIAAAAGALVAGTITTGGTAQTFFATTPTNGFEIINTHATETLYIKENGTATVADNGSSIPIPPKGYYCTPLGYKPTGDVSVIAATTGHALIGRRW